MGSKYNSSWENDCRIQRTFTGERYINTQDIYVPRGYKVDIVATGLDTPICMTFNDLGEILYADSGEVTGNPKVCRLSHDKIEHIASGFNTPITGVNFKDKNIYVSHRGVITTVSPDGIKSDIILGLPSHGDFSNNKVTFGPDGKMYFGQGTATNSGVVGLDNHWLVDYPFFHDFPGSYVMVNGQNFATKNILIPAEESAHTGAFSPFSIPYKDKFEIVRSFLCASGSILKANPDGSDLELVAWGFRNPFEVKFDIYQRVFVINQGYDARGSRPIANAPDELQLIIPGTWYGWPDYSAGEPVNMPKFSSLHVHQPEFLLANHPSIPPKPYTVFPPNSMVMGFDINKESHFGPVGDFYIAEFGAIKNDLIEEEISSSIGHRITKVDMSTGLKETFAINKTGEPAYIAKDGTIIGGGFSRPTDVVFGPDGAMYILDYAIYKEDNPYEYLPKTGVVWKISKVN